MGEFSGPPIIIKKKKDGHAGHGGAWKVAYADFVTAMMALFIVLWVLGQDSSTREAVARYFKNPIGFSNGGANVLKGGPKNIVSLHDEGDVKKADERERLKRMGDKIITELSANPDFSNLMSQIKVEIVDEGLRIEILDSADDIFFEIGTADLKPAAKKLLQQIAEQLKKIPNRIVIEGHTDSRPYSGKLNGYSNFELSSDRANSARRVLISCGLSDQAVREIRGYADRHLRDLQNPYDVINRRISIIITFSGT